MTNKTIKTKSVSECLELIYNNQVGESSIKEMSKDKLEDFVLEVFNKGILNDYLSLH